MVFPNSHAERSHLMERFAGVLTQEVAPQIVVVLNGIDPPPVPQGISHGGSDAGGGGAVAGGAVDSVRGAFVCAGAIGPRKNQLNLVKAFRRLPNERLAVIGQASPGSDRYLRAVRRSAGLNVQFLPNVPHEEMPAIWHSAKACAQPSWIETPGLSAMEALAAGAPVVAADVPPVREYFGDAVWYCDPASPASIAVTCRRAATANRGLGAAFADKYQWDGVLMPLVRAYESLEGNLSLG
jgi:glycosyltransferase involved in cell wall biosynthesis